MERRGGSVDLVSIKLALHTSASEVHAISLEGWPVIELEDTLSKGLATEVTAALTSMDGFHDPKSFFFRDAPDVDSTECFSMKYTPYDSIPLSNSFEDLLVIYSGVLWERLVPAVILDVEVPRIPVFERLLSKTNTSVLMA